MKSFWLGIALWAGLSGQAAVADTTGFDRAGAEAVVSAYLGALVQGDVGTIRPLLGGAFGDRKAALLNTPGYGARLAGLYAGASHRITRVEGLANGTLAVDAQLLMDDASTLDTRFIVEPVIDPRSGQARYRVIGEVD